MLDATWPPSSVTSLFASSLVNFESVPVKTKLFPVSGSPLATPASEKVIPRLIRFSTSIRFFSSENHALMLEATSGPIPSTNMRSSSLAPMIRSIELR